MAGVLDRRKQIILGLAVVSIFIFLVTVLVFVYAVSMAGEEVPDLFRPFLTHHPHFMVLMGLFGVFSGLAGYWLVDKTIEEERKIAKLDNGLLMRLLGPGDREVVGLLFERGGEVQQSELARLEGMTRLKAHRAIRKLEARGIVRVQKNGKINRVLLVDELRQLA